MRPYVSLEFRLWHCFAHIGPVVNQPHIPPCATWKTPATTLAGSALLNNPQVVSVNTNNTVFAASGSGPIYAWHENETIPYINRTSFSGTIYSLFATPNGKIFAGISVSTGISEIHMWTSNDINSTVLITTTTPCYGLFVDDIDRIYCSLGDVHTVIILTLNDSAIINSTSVGQLLPGNTSDLLNIPAGIFVTSVYKLYVADSGNGRIQLFLPGHLNATTVAGAGALGTVELAFPWAVALDAHDFMFIVDYVNSRVVGEGPNGFQCIAGCPHPTGSADDQLSYPKSLSFDSYGNIFVADTINNRIQKFILTRKPCGECFSSETLLRI